HVELVAVPHASELLERLLRVRGEAVQLANHQLHDVVGVALFENAMRVPSPAPCTVVKAEQSFLSQCRNELDAEEGVPRRLVVNQPCERSGALRLAMKR